MLFSINIVSTIPTLYTKLSALVRTIYPPLISPSSTVMCGFRWLRLSEQNFRVDKWSLCRG